MDTIEFTSPKNIEARALIASLNTTLGQITGNEGQGSRFEDGFDPTTDAFLLVKADGEPVACGGLRHINATQCEVKRVFSRSKGYGNKVLSALEARAGEIGYDEMMIATRRTNQGAVEFYLRHGYIEIAQFGKYDDPDRSICLKKVLPSTFKATR